MAIKGQLHSDLLNLQDTVFILLSFVIFALTYEAAPSRIHKLIQLRFRGSNKIQESFEVQSHPFQSFNWIQLMFVLSFSYLIVLLNNRLHWMFANFNPWTQWLVFACLLIIIHVLKKLISRLVLFIFNFNPSKGFRLFPEHNNLLLAVSIFILFMVVYVNLRVPSFVWLINGFLGVALILYLGQTLEVLRSLRAQKTLSFFQIFFYLCMVEVFPLAIVIKLLLVYM